MGEEVNRTNTEEATKPFLDLEKLSAQWQSDLKKLQEDLQSVMHDLTHTTIEIKVEGQKTPIRTTEIDLVSGDIVITLPKESQLTEEQINEINEKAIQMARDELEKRMEKLRQIIEALIKVLQGMVPGGAIKQGLDIIGAIVSKPQEPTADTS